MSMLVFSLYTTHIDSCSSSLTFGYASTNYLYHAPQLGKNCSKHNNLLSNSLYINLIKHQVYFFDSYGSDPEDEIKSFMRKAATYMETKGTKPNNIIMKWNKTQHQRENSECGVYSINFLLRINKNRV